MDNEKLVEYISQLVIDEINSLNMDNKVPVGISARHIHLKESDFRVLFGNNSELTFYNELSQPNQFAANEKVDLVGEKGTIKNVRILGPFRNETQVEIATSDVRKLGLKNVPVRQSGDIKNSAGLKIIGPKGELVIEDGVIIARRHLHATPLDAKRLGVKDGDIIEIVANGEKGGVLSNVIVSVGDNYKLDLHIDTDDASAFDIKQGQMLTFNKI